MHTITMHIRMKEKIEPKIITTIIQGFNCLSTFASTQC